MDDQPIGLIVAVGSARGFALANSLQHQAAAAFPTSTLAGTARHLITSPVWAAGILTGAVAFVLHAYALGLAPLAVVQPVMLAGCVLAVPVRAALDRQRPGRAELGAVTLTVGGLSAFLVAADLKATGHLAGAALAPAVATAVVAAAALSLAAARMPPGRLPAAVLGAAAGLLFGLTAVMAKVAAESWDAAASLDSLATWPVWLLVAAGVCGLVVNQRAYQLAPLSASLPVVNVVNIAVAVSLGLLVFNEAVNTAPPALMAQTIGLVCVVGGLTRLHGRDQHPAPERAQRALHRAVI